MLQALRDNLIIKPIYREKESAIFIPEIAKKYKQYDAQVLGEVISVGPKFNLTFEREPLKPKDQIIFQRHEGIKFVYEGQTYLKLNQKRVLAKYERGN